MRKVELSAVTIYSLWSFIISDVNSSYADFIDLPEETFSLFIKENIAEKTA